MKRNNSTIYLIILIVAVSAGLLFYRLLDLMPFSGDQGWFYLSARDMLLTGNIPFVGIASSHPWLHQGPFWTYTLAIIFSLTHFNPLAPGYFTAGLGVIMVFLVYFIGRHLFSKNIGLIAAFFYSTSPLVIITARMPYHTSFIPLFVLAFIWSLYKWLQGDGKYFPFTIFLVACLYNFEIATTPFSFIIFLCLTYGIWKKKKFVLVLANKKIVFYSFIAWLVPMLPMLLYDRTHGFPQTIKFVLWLGYHFARLFGYPDIHADTVFTPLAPFLPFTVTKIQYLLFLPQSTIAILLFIGAFLYVSYCVYASAKNKKINNAQITLYLTFTIPFVSYLVLHTSSEAYWSMFFPTSILILALGFEKLLEKKQLFFISLIIMLAIGLVNVYTLVKENYLMTYSNYGYPFKERIRVSRQITTQTRGRAYNIIGRGEGSEFSSFTMNYTYLTWWMGHGPSQKKQRLRFVIQETPTKIVLSKRVN